MMLEVVLVFSPIFTLFISFFPKRIPKLCWKTDYGQKSKLVQRGWRKWMYIPTGVGVSILAALHWHRLNKERDYPSESIVKEFEITCYRSLPLRLWSRTWGLFCCIPIPTPLRSFVYNSYCKLSGVNLDEIVGDFSDYPTLGKFFTRPMKPGLRPIDNVDCIVSPADGRVLNSGRINSCHVEQVKGVTYNLQTFLGPHTWDSQPDDTKSGRQTDENDNEVVLKELNADKFMIPEVFWGGVDMVRYFFKPEEEKCDRESWDDYKSKLLTNPDNVLYQAVIYLAPGNYHRFHSPVQWTVKFRRHFQGELMSVNPLIAGWLPGLYSLNERAVYVGQWKHGFFSMTAVGATQVGSIRIYNDETLVTNSFKFLDRFEHKDMAMDYSWEKGEEIGEFKMGSTLVLVFEAPKNYKFNLCPNQKVKVGQPLSGCKI